MPDITFTNTVEPDVSVKEENQYVSEQPEEEKIPGLSTEELNDPNKIDVTVADTNAPLLILFGPPSCGKTMTLVRLTRFLKQEGYKVSPIKSFRPAFDKNYEKMCEDFDIMINDRNAANATNRISFMLVEVVKDGRRICQILEAPGEFYFNPKDPHAQFPAFVNTLINGNNRKIFALMTEPDWMDEHDRANYVNRVSELKKKIRPRDKVMFILNKIDKTNFVIGPGQVNVGEAMKQINFLYPGIYQPFKNLNPITSLWNPYRFDFVPFQTGDYTKASDGTLTYQEGPVEYPRQLWKVVLKRIRG